MEISVEDIFPMNDAFFLILEEVEEVDDVDDGGQLILLYLG